MKPVVAIADWKDSPQGDPESKIERSILEPHAKVVRHLANDPEELPAAVFDADVVILWHNIAFGAAAIDRLSRCRAIIRNGVGFDSVDVAAAAQRGIPVCNVPDYGTEEVADHAIALALALCRQLFPLDAEAKALGWLIKVTPQLRRLRGRRFAIIGLGRIGTAVALRAKAFGCRVLFFDPYLPRGVEKAVGVERVESIEELLRQADVLSVHCPLNAETHHLLGAPELALLTRGAFVVNTARGAIIEKAALFATLRSGHLGGAGLDVIEDEPLQSAEEAATPNLVATCHAAFCSVESKAEMCTSSARIALQVLRGQTPDNRVN